MSITTAVVLVVLILVASMCVAGTLVALALIKGWVEVRKINTRTVVSKSATNTRADPIADHPMFHQG